MPIKRDEWMLPVLLYALLTATLFDPGVRRVLVLAFGERPLGVPVLALVAVAQSLLVLPLLWCAVHLQRIMRQALADGRGVGLFSLLLDMRAIGRRHPELRYSQLVCAFGLVYGLIVAGAWIFYADHLGI
ncbi:hypothetical protein M2650_08105 [Luteimonas sp. SX5]|uniref:Uncharacterized protein n=1 Tax=Luteimonas galliterrae TaxID=2940486 RepID=A0ABT0MI94_9GAMM|nr:hypothetical protein [Luteimonas galliterrae]MCL1634591.1 hypothetical protein [Luteimonas galliterrae]